MKTYDELLSENTALKNENEDLKERIGTTLDIDEARELDAYKKEMFNFYSERMGSTEIYGDNPHLEQK